jgi:glyoxylase-like metal-dependent hydrolase (beta-lactamase superfamily II)
MTAQNVRPEVVAFFDEPTNTISYLVGDPETGRAAIIDSVLEFDMKSARTGTAGADKILADAERRGWRIELILETHCHADHLSAAPYLKTRTGAPVGIGSAITEVQRAFAEIYNVTDLAPGGRDFDRLFADGEQFALGAVPVRIIHTPGHTPACITYVIGDAAFVGDTLFMPDYGTARCDFPGGDARQLYRSIRRILDLPGGTRLFLCHDYKAPGRDRYAWETTVAEQRARNIHVHDGIDEDAFVTMRTNRDRNLTVPTLLLPSVQVNMRAGHLPPAEANGTRYLKLPIDRF